MKYWKSRPYGRYGYALAGGIGAVTSLYRRFRGGGRSSGIKRKFASAVSSRKRMRFGASRTMTKRRNKLQIVAASASGNSFSSFYSKARTSKVSKKIWKTISAPHCYMWDSSGRLEANHGEQNATYIPHFDYVNGNIMMNNAGITVGEPGKIFLSGYQSDLMITNQDSGNCRVTLYDVVSRRDTQEIDLIDIWDDGLKENTGTSGNTRAVGNLNSTPFQSSEFCSKFKILKTTKIQMAAGQSHVHKVRIKYSTMLSRDVVDDYQYYHGLSYCTIVVVHGMPYNAVTNQAEVATGDCAIDWVRTQKHFYRSVDNNENMYGYTKAQASFSTAENVMNKIGDAIPDEEA